MTHGGPDFGVSQVISHIYSIKDLGDLAVLLGGPSTFDRRGHPIWDEGFERGLSAWTPLVTAGGIKPSVINTASRNGAYACKLITPTPNGAYSKITHRRGLLQACSYGVEFSFTQAKNSNNLDIVFTLGDVNLTQVAGLRVGKVAGSISVWNNTGAWASVLTGLTWYDDSKLFHTIKLSFDFATGKYQRLLFDNRALDISATRFQQAIGVAASYTEATITLTNLLAASNTVYIDDLLLTIDE